MQKQPFADASWIWHQTPCVDLVNKFIQARKLFGLARVPRKAEILITADSSYRLFVNGCRVGQGPARGFQKAWPFDRVDIAPFLRQGENVIAVLAHCLGVHNAKYLHTGWAGLIIEGHFAGTCVSTGPDWKVRRSPGHLRTHARLSAQTDFQEQFDARLDDGGWQRVGYDDSTWEAPWAAFPPYVPPWPDFSERGLPPLAETLLPARAIVAEGRGRAGAVEENVCLAHFNSEPRWTVCRRPLRRSGVFGECILAPPGKGAAASYCLDFGHMVVGYPMLEIRGARGGEILDVLLSEVTSLSGIPRITDPRHDPNGTSVGHRLVLRRGLTRHETYFYSGFRYLVLTLRAGAPPLRVRAAVRNIAYPLDPRAAFRSSDARLNRIHQACVLSMKCCLQDAQVDCPTREQAQWWGLRMAANAALYLVNDPRIIARGLRQIGMQTADNGLVYSTAPSFLHNWILPECAWSWIVNLGDYYNWTGDLSVFRAAAGSVRSVLAFTAAEMRRGQGLVPTEYHGYQYRLGMSDARLFKSGAARYCLAHNLAALQAFRTAVRLWRAAGDAGAARQAQASAVELARAISLRFSVPHFPYFHDALSPRFKPVPLPGPQFNFHILSRVIINGLAGKQAGAIAAYLWELMQRVGVDKFKPAASALYVPMHALFQVGYRRELVDYIRKYWGIWIEERSLTTTPEHWWFEAQAMPHGAMAHSWATFPIEFFALILLGVRRDAVAWRRMRFAPDFSAVASASGCVPTPLGYVDVAWHRAGGRVRGRLAVPRGMQVVFNIGGRRARRTGPFVERFEVAVAHQGKGLRVGS